MKDLGDNKTKKKKKKKNKKRRTLLDSGKISGTRSE
jgi:hypothetical protein